MARLIELKQTAPERFLARFDTGEEVRTTLAVVTDFHLRSASSSGLVSSFPLRR